MVKINEKMKLWNSWLKVAKEYGYDRQTAAYDWKMYFHEKVRDHRISDLFVNFVGENGITSL